MKAYYFYRDYSGFFTLFQLETFGTCVLTLCVSHLRYCKAISLVKFFPSFKLYIYALDIFQKEELLGRPRLARKKGSWMNICKLQYLKKCLQAFCRVGFTCTYI